MLEDIGDVDTKSTFLPWQNMAAKTVQSTGEDTVAHGKKTPTLSFYPSLVRMPMASFFSKAPELGRKQEHCSANSTLSPSHAISLRRQIPLPGVFQSFERT